MNVAEETKLDEGRLFAIGDIHGCSTALRTLIEAIDPRTEDTIIALGDLIDFGPDSKGVIEQSMDLSQRCNLILVMGNHEEMLLAALDSRSEFNSWLYSGGEGTLDSYGAGRSLDLIPDAHAEFILCCRDFYETETHIFVHANYDHSLPMEQLGSRWLRWEFIEPNRLCPPFSGKRVVVGHTPQVSGEVLDLGFLICIDTDCSRGGWLTALEVGTGEIVQANERGECRKTIRAQTVPDWIANARAPLGQLPIREVLSGSVYYPSCRFDGDPVMHLAGNFHSFIYVDYGVGRDELVRRLDEFRGYRIVAFRDVTERELTPNGWTPQYPGPADGSPQASAARIRPPFGVWSIHERTEQYGPDHGPDRFSLLYIGGDGVATFQALYHGNGVAPAAVAVIQPGHGFGGNWTDFEDPERIFARSVFGNPAGAPKYLLFGGWGEGEDYRQPCWPEYGVAVRKLRRDGRLRLWTRDAHPERKEPAGMEVSIDGADSEAAIDKPVVDAEAPRNEPRSRGEAAETRGIQCENRGLNQEHP